MSSLIVEFLSFFEKQIYDAKTVLNSDNYVAVANMHSTLGRNVLFINDLHTKMETKLLNLARLQTQLAEKLLENLNTDLNKPNSGWKVPPVNPNTLGTSFFDNKIKEAQSVLRNGDDVVVQRMLSYVERCVQILKDFVRKIAKRKLELARLQTQLAEKQEDLDFMDGLDPDDMDKYESDTLLGSGEPTKSKTLRF